VLDDGDNGREVDVVGLAFGRAGDEEDLAIAPRGRGYGAARRGESKRRCWPIGGAPLEQLLPKRMTRERSANATYLMGRLHGKGAGGAAPA
jgi:hypothetical protein